MEGLIPLWLKIAYGVFTPFLIVVYWPRYGVSNFLWLSDIALFFTAAAVIFEWPLLASMPAVGVLPLELFWTLDFILLGRFGLTSYMFDPRWPLWLRLISLFHLALPPTWFWMMWKFGYEPDAFPLQVALTWIVLLICYLFTDPEKNINWAFGPGEKPQTRISPRLYFAIVMVVIPLCVMTPTHVALWWLFGPGGIFR
ncbi:MAG: hypothetical protein IT539_15195 [Bradyrhizobiaceae bacterium]|nr:hypothetical protein [Bradyrhizobiaceae bacterium]